ncbi:MAG: hypothetical protein MJ231_06875 [bacterium]|nr:hypothetical protein [bacterium]
MAKKSKNALAIFLESIGLYFSNFDKFVKYMTFPVLGQLVGLILIFLCSYLFSTNMPVIIDKNPSLNNFNTLVLIAILISVPGLIILMKAFWEYLVAYGAINSMLENMLKSGKVYDFDAHTELIKRRSLSFVGLWLLIGIFSIFAMCPLLWVPAGVVAVFLVLIFQVFTYEPELSPFGCVIKSMSLIKGHFASTFMLIALVGALTYFLIPQIVNTLFNVLGITKFLSNLIVPFVSQFPISEINAILIKFYLKPLEIEFITVSIISTTIMTVLVQYTLPMRTLLWGMWYRELNGGLTDLGIKKKSSRSATTKSHKRPSEKLMEESHKKFATKKIDKNILKRAMEKDDEENS